MALFDPAYNIIEQWEGGYANVPGDKGGETYAGIARVFWPNWSGWGFIDSWKAKNGPIKNNAKFANLNNEVRQFYNGLWTAGMFDKINSQDVANILFDFRVNSGNTAIKKIQSIVGVTADGVLGPQTLAAINSMNAATLNNAIKDVREKFYISLSRQPGQEKFLAGWLNRLNSFPTLTIVGGGLAVVLLVIVAVIYLNK